MWDQRIIVGNYAVASAHFPINAIMICLSFIEGNDNWFQPDGTRSALDCEAPPCEVWGWTLNTLPV